MKMYKTTIFLLSTVYITYVYSSRCDQTPPKASVLTPSENEGIFTLNVVAKETIKKDKYLPDQTYVLILEAKNTTRPFRWFRITAEDPSLDGDSYDRTLRPINVGKLNILDKDIKSRYSERCTNSVESADNSDKYRIEIRWFSPKQSNSDPTRDETVRIRAMVAENSEVWYVGEGLTIVLTKDTNKSIDSPPYDPIEECNLCSEARYEIIFTGHWSRGSHPRYYPSKPDENGFSHIVGASHAYNYTMWKQGSPASPGLRKLAEDADIDLLEREIIDQMIIGTRTLIRGKRRYHPDMLKPTYALFRVDRIYHLFSVAVAMKPSPDWFLGTSRFELCTQNGWLEHYRQPLYPWDAGSMEGLSYESPRQVTQPDPENIERVEVGSYHSESPFNQMNLDDLQPFAYLEVNRLDVYPLVGAECNDADGDAEEDSQNEEKKETEDVEQADEEPSVAESKQFELDQRCELSEWGTWSSCRPDLGQCGTGLRTRTRLYKKAYYFGDKQMRNFQTPANREESCQGEDVNMLDLQECIVEC